MTSPVRTKQKFETFVMTGDTIIKTRSISPQLRSSQISLNHDGLKYPSLSLNTDPIPSKTFSNDFEKCNKKHHLTKTSPVKGIILKNVLKIQSPRNLDLDIPPDDISSEDEFYKEEVVDVDRLPPPPDDFFMEPTSNRASTEKSITEQQNALDDSLMQSQLSRHRSYDSITAEGRNPESDKMQTSRNSPDLVDHKKVCVRNYKSHENYLQLENSVEFVPIVFEETGAISIDALNYNKIEFPNAKQGDQMNLHDSIKRLQTHGNGFTISSVESGSKDKDKSSTETGSVSSLNLQSSSPESSFPNNSLTRKDVDLPSAQRLAKRLFTLDGFQQTDIAKHLGKRDTFSALVGQEYLKYFDFKGQKLDVALRSFLSNLILVGETQERERVLSHFSQRFVECNKDFTLSQDSCHTLICAMMLLNIDHHSQNIARKMTLDEFMDNLSALNDGEDFPEYLLKDVYHSVCNEPFKCPMDAVSFDFNTAASTPVVGNNPFLSAPDQKKAREYKKGFVMRKCCMDPDGHRTSFGKRGWRMFYATLKDLVLFLHKDEHGMKRNNSSDYQNNHNAIRIHHALAEKANDYIKKQHVFRLTTSDSAQFLFQTSDNAECQSWVNCINFVAATLSSAPLPSAVGSQKKFQRPLMPSSHTKLNPLEQLQKLRSCLTMFENELEEHRANSPEKGSKSRIVTDYLDKENFLVFEVKRFQTYCSLILPHDQNSHSHHQTSEHNPNTIPEECQQHSPASEASEKESLNFKRSQSDRPAIRPGFLLA